MSTPRMVPAVVTHDGGAGLVETPLRLRNWVAFVGSWFLLAAGAVGLFTGGLRIMEVGGFCASGGPYEIAVACPPGSAATMIVAMCSVAVAVLVGIFVARGLGPPVHGWCWSVLFGTQGAAFLIAAFRAPRLSVAWLVCGVLFMLVALPPALLIRIGWPRSIFGRRRLDGRSLVNQGLPVRDAAVLAAVWLMASTAGVSAAILVT